MSDASDFSEPGGSIAEYVVNKVSKIQPGETVEIVCLKGTFPLAGAFAAATRRAGARALIRLQEAEANSDEESTRRRELTGPFGRVGLTHQQWTELSAGAGPVASIEQRHRFFEALEGLVAGRRITITRPEADRTDLAVGVEHRGGIDTVYFGRPADAVRTPPVIGDRSVMPPMVA